MSLLAGNDTDMVAGVRSTHGPFTLRRSEAPGRAREQAFHREATRPEPPASAAGAAAARGELPTRLVIDDQVIHIDSFPVGEGTVLITRGDQDHFSLLVVPPHATPDAARAAMAGAVRADNVIHAAQILIDTGTHQAHPIPAEAPRTGELHHSLDTPHRTARPLTFVHCR
ncbi:DUF5994 family protein [Streptomyces sp. GD-15H]|uniref:DUF5994 family protein n=1 Tax=Streptomyces sp. GD-15H TaxID=3129112 RepID=UPI00324BB948